MPTKLTRKNLHGVWCALIVPWTDRDELDESRWADECRSYGGTGVHGIYTGGTTGEYYAQDDDTFARITRIACREAKAVGLPVQIGCTTLSTRTACQRIRVALEHGADAIQIAHPFWLEMKPDELLKFMVDISIAAGDTPIIHYNTSRSKRKMSPKEVGIIAREAPTFIGMKDTGCDVPTLKAMLAEAPDLAIFGGEDNFYTKIPAGGRGGYCSTTGLNARYIVELYNLCVAGKLEQAKPYHDTLAALFEATAVPMVEKEGLWDSAVDRLFRIVGGGDVGVRCAAPYRAATEEHVSRLRDWCAKHAPQLLKK